MKFGGGGIPEKPGGGGGYGLGVDCRLKNDAVWDWEVDGEPVTLADVPLAPGVVEVAPVDDEEAPVDDEEAPVDDEEAPVDDEEFAS